MSEPGATGSPEQPPRPGSRPEPGSRNEARAWLIVILLALVVAYLIWFAIDNSHTVPVHWVFGTTHSSLIWVILVTLILGAIVGLLALGLSRRRSRRAKRPDR
jgi:uncharacterized integral membrane protein